jgi:hypothetical protein
MIDSANMTLHIRIMKRHFRNMTLYNSIIKR